LRPTKEPTGCAYLSGGNHSRTIGEDAHGKQPCLAYSLAAGTFGILKYPKRAP
jgi:hypothetical protein